MQHRLQGHCLGSCLIKVSWPFFLLVHRGASEVDGEGRAGRTGRGGGQAGVQDTAVQDSPPESTQSPSWVPWTAYRQTTSDLWPLTSPAPPACWHLLLLFPSSHSAPSVAYSGRLQGGLTNRKSRFQGGGGRGLWGGGGCRHAGGCGRRSSQSTCPVKLFAFSFLLRVSFQLCWFHCHLSLYHFWPKVLCPSPVSFPLPVSFQLPVSSRLPVSSQPRVSSPLPVCPWLPASCDCQTKNKAVMPPAVIAAVYSSCTKRPPGL